MFGKSGVLLTVKDNLIVNHNVKPDNHYISLLGSAGYCNSWPFTIYFQAIRSNKGVKKS